jgi:hypothetical protein
MKKSLFFCLAAAFVFVGAVWAANNTNLFNVFGTGADRNTLMFYIEDDGDAVFSQDVAVTGTLTTTGATTQTGALGVTGMITATGGLTLPIVDVTVSSPTVLGQVVSTSAGLLYISTAAVADVDSWVKVGGQ